MQIGEHYWNLRWKGTERKKPQHEKESVLKTGAITPSKGKQDEYVGHFWGAADRKQRRGGGILMAVPLWYPASFEYLPACRRDQTVVSDAAPQALMATPIVHHYFLKRFFDICGWLRRRLKVRRRLHIMAQAVMDSDTWTDLKEE